MKAKTMMVDMKLQPLDNEVSQQLFLEAGFLFMCGISLCLIRVVIVEPILTLLARKAERKSVDMDVRVRNTDQGHLKTVSDTSYVTRLCRFGASARLGSHIQVEASS